MSLIFVQLTYTSITCISRSLPTIHHCHCHPSSHFTSHSPVIEVFYNYFFHIDIVVVLLIIIIDFILPPLAVTLIVTTRNSQEKKSWRKRDHRPPHHGNHEFFKLKIWMRRPTANFLLNPFLLSRKLYLHYDPSYRTLTHHFYHTVTISYHMHLISFPPKSNPCTGP